MPLHPSEDETAIFCLVHGKPSPYPFYSLSHTFISTLLHSTSDYDLIQWVTLRLSQLAQGVHDIPITSQTHTSLCSQVIFPNPLAQG